MKVLLILTSISGETLYEKLFKKNMTDNDYIFYFDYQLSVDDYELNKQIENEFVLQ